MGLNASLSYATCDAPECENGIAIPSERIGSVGAALDWLLGEGWGVGVKHQGTYCPHHGVDE
jgi:hypothetical protein